MDDVTRKAAVASGWQPVKRFGKVEIGVNVWSEQLGRVGFDAVSPQEYLELWHKGLFRHQIDGASKPEHLPTPEEVLDYLEAERHAVVAPLVEQTKRPRAITSNIPVVKREKPEEKRVVKNAEDVSARVALLRETLRKAKDKPKPPPKIEVEEELVEEDDDPIPEPTLEPVSEKEVTIQAPAPTPAPVEEKTLVERAAPKAPPVDLAVAIQPKDLNNLVDACAKRMVSLTLRQQEVLKAGGDGADSLPGLTEASFKVQFGDACRYVGMPLDRALPGTLTRYSLAKRICVRYEELLASGEVVKPQVLQSLAVKIAIAVAKMSVEQKEQLLLHIHKQEVGAQPPTKTQVDPWVDACARKIPKLSERQQHIMLAGSDGRRALPDLPAESFRVKFGQAYRQIGITKDLGLGKLERHALIRKVYARFEELVAQGELVRVIPASTSIGPAILDKVAGMSVDERQHLLVHLQSIMPGK